MVKVVYVLLWLCSLLPLVVVSELVYPLLEDNDPGLIRIERELGYGSGYLTNKGEIYTVHHVLRYWFEPPYWQGSSSSIVQAEVLTNLVYQGEDLDQWSDFNCQMTLFIDGICIGTTNVTGTILYDPEFEFFEVGFYHLEYQAWMFFTVISRDSYGFVVQGVMLDIDLDSRGDFQSFVCRGMSGSPAIVTQDGHLLRTPDGYLVAVGQLRGARGDMYTLGGRDCSNRAYVIS